jgi:hypothetical protein
MATDKDLAVKGPMMGATRHGLYFRADKLEIEPDSSLGIFFKRTLEGLLERFPDPPPLAAAALAQRLTYKLIRAASFEAYVLQSGEAPSPTADANYLHLAGSIRSDRACLWFKWKAFTEGYVRRSGSINDLGDIFRNALLKGNPGSEGQET